MNKAKGLARTHPTLVGFVLVVVVLFLLWAVIIAIAVTAYNVFA